MDRAHLEHLIRAAAGITGERDFVVIGSQAILGEWPDAPRVLRVSIEADLYPRDRPDLADLIEGSIGELSAFHETFGYYAQGVGPETAVLPAGWQSRLVPLRSEATAGATAWCLETHDLVVSKLFAGRPKDLAFARGAKAHRLVRRRELDRRAADLPTSTERRDIVRAHIAALWSKGTSGGS